MADGSLLHILAGMVVLSQCWYNISAGDGSLMSMVWLRVLAGQAVDLHCCIWLVGVHV